MTPDHGETHPPKRKIVVNGHPDDDGGGGGGGTYVGGGDIFVFYPSPGSGGSIANTSPPPAVEEEEETDAGREIVVRRASLGQETFADDGNLFNDGQAPTRETVIGWIDDLLAGGVTREVEIVTDPNNQDVFTGSYTDAAGNEVVFSSDGKGNYFLGTQSSGDGFGGMDERLPPVDPFDMVRLPDNYLDYHLL